MPGQSLLNTQHLLHTQSPASNQHVLVVLVVVAILDVHIVVIVVIVIVVVVIVILVVIDVVGRIYNRVDH